MIINLSNPREDYYTFPSETDILRRILTLSENPKLIEKSGLIQKMAGFGEEKGNAPRITDKDLVLLSKEGLLFAGIPGEDGVERILNGQYSKDDLNDYYLIDTIESIIQGQEGPLPDKAMMFPQEYALPDLVAKGIMAHPVLNDVEMMNLETMDARRIIFGEKGLPVPKSWVLSARQKTLSEWEPEKVLRTNVELRKEKLEGGGNLGNLLMGYWRDRYCNKMRFAFIRNHIGAEMRVAQNYAYWKHLLSRLPKAIKDRKHPGSGQRLSQWEIERMRRKYQRNMAYIKKHNLQQVLDRVKFDESDMIEFETPTKGELKRFYQAPSRSRAKGDVYHGELDFLAILEPGDSRSFSMIWNYSPTTYQMLLRKFTSDREARRYEHIEKTRKEHLFIPQEVAALHGVFRSFEVTPKAGRRLPFNLFTISQQVTASFVDFLRYGSFFHMGNRRKQTNQTEMERLYCKRLMRSGYEDVCTTEKARLKGDPNLYMLRFIN